MDEDVPICRVCLQTSLDYVDLETPFDIERDELISCTDSVADPKHGNKFTYLDCFKECTGLEVAVGENQPDRLCGACALELRIAYEFIRKAERAERILKESVQEEKEFGVLPETSEHQVFLEETEFIKLCEYEENLEEEGTETINCDDATTTCSSIKDKDSENYRGINGHKYNDMDCTTDQLEENCGFEAEMKSENASDIEDTEQTNESDLRSDKSKCSIKERFEDSSGNDNEYFQRNNCDKRFNNKYSLHIRHRTNNYNNTKSQGLKNSLQNRKWQANECREEKCNFPCNVCSKTFATLSILNAHLKYHQRKQSNTKSDACSICGKQFSTNHYLARHMEVHKNNRKLYECTQCDKLYLTNTALKNHRKLHMGETIKCVSCNKEFSRQYELNVHMRFHTRDFPFECEICGKKFAIKGHLRTHMWRHQGLKLQCEDCGKLFVSSKALNEHSFIHSEMPFPCSHCSKSYPSKQKFKVHLKTAHAIELNKDELMKITRSGPRRPIRRKKLTLVQADSVMKEVEVKTKNEETDEVQEVYIELF